MKSKHITGNKQGLTLETFVREMICKDEGPSNEAFGQVMFGAIVEYRLPSDSIGEC